MTRNKFVPFHIVVARKTHFIVVINNFKYVAAISCGSRISMLAVAFRTGEVITVNFVVNTFLKLFLDSFEFIFCKRFISSVAI